MDKPAGLLCQPGKARSEADLYSLARDFLGRREGCPAPYLGLAHRIDRGTSGVVLFTKTRHINPAIAELFAEGKIEKRYLALCAKAGEPPCPSPPEAQEWSIENRLEPKVSRGRRRQRVVNEGGQVAVTRFQILSTFRDAYSIEAKPATGRFHQIRIHLAGAGLPILGDRLYGYPNRVRRWASRPMLHATRLAFDHPRENRRIEVESPLPSDFQLALATLESAT